MNPISILFAITTSLLPVVEPIDGGATKLQNQISFGARFSESLVLRNDLTARIAWENPSDPMEVANTTAVIVTPNRGLDVGVRTTFSGMANQEGRYFELTDVSERAELFIRFGGWNPIDWR
jgi:hypothetical protein